MKAAFPVWKDNMAPVFDVATNFRIVEVSRGTVRGEINETISAPMPHLKVIRLREMGVNVLICGAISRSVQNMVSSHGIRVIPFITGNIHEVIKAWLEGRMNQNTFGMPGCRGRGRKHRFRGKHHRKGGM